MTMFAPRKTAAAVPRYPLILLCLRMTIRFYTGTALSLLNKEVNSFGTGVLPVSRQFEAHLAEPQQSPNASNAMVAFAAGRDACPGQRWTNAWRPCRGSCPLPSTLGFMPLPLPVDSPGEYDAHAIRRSGSRLDRHWPKSECESPHWCKGMSDGLPLWMLQHVGCWPRRPFHICNTQGIPCSRPAVAIAR